MKGRPDRLRSPADYRRSVVRVYALLVFTFVVAGLAGRLTDSLTLFIGFEPARAEGAAADVLASFCLLFAACRGTLRVQEYTGGPAWRPAPWIVAVVAIGVLYAAMRAGGDRCASPPVRPGSGRDRSRGGSADRWAAAVAASAPGRR